VTAEARTNQHYNKDPRIFGLFLDTTRKYSSGLYRGPGDSLDQAQRNKLHYIAGRLGLRPGQRLLDIGCGWGSLILFMAAEYGVTTVGISPAANQHAYIAERAAQLGLAAVSTRAGQIEDLELQPRSFDAITMLGSIVHMPDLHAVYRKAWQALKPRGRLYVSESCYRNAARRARFAGRENSVFVTDSIFGWGDMRPLSDLVRGAEDAGFSVIAVDDLTSHYRRTIEDWLANVGRNAGALDDIEPGLSGRLARYLRTANAGWGFTTKHYSLTCEKSR
jgi:cyclopropane-fatty-acyl-phospholipid synthase